MVLVDGEGDGFGVDDGAAGCGYGVVVGSGWGAVGVGVVVGAGGWGAVLGGSEGAALVLCARLLLKEAVDGFSLSLVYVVSLGC